MNAPVSEKFLTTLLGEPSPFTTGLRWWVGKLRLYLTVFDGVTKVWMNNTSMPICYLPTEGRVHHFLHAVGFEDFAFKKDKGQS